MTHEPESHHLGNVANTDTDTELTDPTKFTNLTDLAVVLRAVGNLVADVPESQWRAPTPCPEWDVRTLVNHLVLGSHLFTAVLRDGTRAAPDALDPTVRDMLGDRPAAAYRNAAENLLSAFAQPGVRTRVFHLPAGVVPGIAAVHLRTVEELVHGWDLARATGRQLRFPEDVVQRELAFTRDRLVDVAPDRTPFAPPQPAPDNAPILDRLAALLGRPVVPPR
ncbi:TIGR03086 family metal-binding protein [Embleya sp. NPDC127516]|uniref:TIGR03086 family metal-binding protein n=1 Tax=Embleya sp. NPDC127516 TaxID=3363990 RepID=UPI00380412A1